MNWPEIGSYLGDKAPYVAVIVVQMRIILKLLDRFFVQQSVLTDALRNTASAIDHAERTDRLDV